MSRAGSKRRGCKKLGGGVKEAALEADDGLRL